MKYLVIGSGGREHTIAWRLINDGSAGEVYVAPGNGGIDPKFRVDLAVNDFPAIAAWCAQNRIDLVVVGPEAPLTDGIVDYLAGQGIPVFGPSKDAARLEGSKLFAKQIMSSYGIPTAVHREFTGRKSLIDYIHGETRYPVVIKLDGLAAGKGVGIPENREDALAFIDASVPDGARVFVEDYIDGEEASVLCVSDGEHFVTFAPAQDHKRAYDGDRGPNTGGMGAYAPAPVMTPERLRAVSEKILAPTISGMRREGTPFRGVLYAGVIVRGDDIRVLEYNVRFGDPEAQVIIPLLQGKLGDLLQASVTGTLDRVVLPLSDLHALTVVMASGGYPGAYEKGKLISGLDRIGEEVTVFHAGTTFSNGNYYTGGGRVLNITALGQSLREAHDKVYRAIGAISFEGSFYRTDIGHRALS